MGPESDEDDAKQVAFLRARIVEAAREGDTPEIQYLVGISAAKRLLTAFDEVRPRMYIHSVRRQTREMILEPSRPTNYHELSVFFLLLPSSLHRYL